MLQALKNEHVGHLMKRMGRMLSIGKDEMEEAAKEAAKFKKEAKE